MTKAWSKHKTFLKDQKHQKQQVWNIEALSKYPEKGKAVVLRKKVSRSNTQETGGPNFPLAKGEVEIVGRNCWRSGQKMRDGLLPGLRKAHGPENLQLGVFGNTLIL